MPMAYAGFGLRRLKCSRENAGASIPFMIPHARLFNKSEEVESRGLAVVALLRERAEDGIGAC